MSIANAYTHCLVALTVMVRSPQSLPERLRLSWEQSLNRLDPMNDLPPELRHKFFDLEAFITKRGGGDGSKDNGAAVEMSEDEAQKGADMLIDLGTAVAAFYHADKVDVSHLIETLD